jgi:hypothetical protein
MDNRLTVLYRLVGVKWGRSRGAEPGAGRPGAKRDSVEEVGKSASERSRDGVPMGKKSAGAAAEKSR